MRFFMWALSLRMRASWLLWVSRSASACSSTALVGPPSTRLSRVTDSVQRPASTQPRRMPGATVLENEPQTITQPSASNDLAALRRASDAIRSLNTTSSISGTWRAASSSTRARLSAWRITAPSGLDKVGTDSTAFTGWVSRASCNASRERPWRGWVGTSSALSCRLCKSSRNEKCVGVSSATTRSRRSWRA